MNERYLETTGLSVAPAAFASYSFPGRRGPSVAFEKPSEGEGGSNAEADRIREELLKNQEQGKSDDKSKAQEQGKDKSDDKSKDKLNDTEAELLRDLMKHKKKAQETAEKLEEVTKKLQLLGDVDPAEAAEAVKSKREAERKALEERGQFDQVKLQMVEEHTKVLAGKDAEITGLKAQIEALTGRLNDMTVGSTFQGSQFVTEKLVLPPTKARALFGAHFEFGEDGKVVGYNKPRGLEGRAPLVDGSGNPLPFDKAMEKIVEIDPDRDRLLKAPLKPGAASDPGRDGGRSPGVNQDKTATTKIAEGLKSLKSGGITSLGGATR